MDFTTRVAIITGGIGGIGQQIARALLERKAKVALLDLDETAGEKVLAKFQEEFGKNNVIFYKCDVTKDEDMEGAFNECEKRLGTANILCNNAGIIHPDAKRTFDVNTLAVISGTELAIKKMSKEHGGSGGNVVNTASILGLAVTPLIPFYLASKAAVVQYTRSAGHKLHYEYSGVCINCVCPDITDTTLVTNKPNRYYNGKLEDIDHHVFNSYRMSPKRIADAVIKLIEDSIPGAALLAEHNGKPYYVAPSIQRELI